MPLTPPNQLVRERILAFGGPSMGKSFAYYTIARLAAKTNTDAHFYVVDTDASAEMMLVDPELATLFNDDGSLKNITYSAPSDWPSLLAVMESYQSKMRRQDWLMIDMLTPTWQWVQDYFVDRVYKKDRSDYIIERRAQSAAANKEGKMLEGNQDWVMINNEYGKLQNMILKSPGNIYCTAEVKALDRKNASKEDILIYGSLGVMPAGQKRTGHLFHSNLWFASDKPGERHMTSAKNRSRGDLLRVPINDFAISYLVSVAGWKLA